MTSRRVYRPHVGDANRAHNAVLAAAVTLGLFMLLPVSEWLSRPRVGLDVRPVDTVRVVEPPPKQPRRRPRTREAPQPRLDRVRPQLEPLAIQAALPLEPGPGDFTLDFKLRGVPGDEALVFEIAEVDTPPKPVRRVKPLYPTAASMRRQEGRVVLEFVVDAGGVPRNVRVRRADPPGVFDAAALTAIKKWRFDPGRRRGEAVATRVILPLAFTLEE